MNRVLGQQAAKRLIPARQPRVGLAGARVRLHNRRGGGRMRRADVDPWQSDRAARLAPTGGRLCVSGIDPATPKRTLDLLRESRGALVVKIMTRKQPRVQAEFQPVNQV